MTPRASRLSSASIVSYPGSRPEPGPPRETSDRGQPPPSLSPLASRKHVTPQDARRPVRSPPRTCRPTRAFADRRASHRTCPHVPGGLARVPERRGSDDPQDRGPRRRTGPIGGRRFDDRRPPLARPRLGRGAGRRRASCPLRTIGTSRSLPIRARPPDPDRGGLPPALAPGPTSRGRPPRPTPRTKAQPTPAPARADRRGMPRSTVAQAVRSPGDSGCPPGPSSGSIAIEERANLTRPGSAAISSSGALLADRRINSRS